MRAAVLGVGVWGPGLDGWEAARAVLAGRQDWRATDAPPPAPSMLSPTERRRASLVVRLGLHVAGAACADAGITPGATRLVFASANGDGVVVHAILESLSSGDGLVSPTHFHNSVHNAPAGYWAIGVRSLLPMTCLGCHDASFGAALLKAMAEVAVDRAPVLLCAYDAPMPLPLKNVRRTDGVFGVALVLAPALEGRPTVALGYVSEPCAAEAGEPEHTGLRALARANPAARSLRLLQALARGTPDRFPIALLDDHLDVRVEPCSTASVSPR